MSRYQYPSFREQFTNDDWTIATTSGGATTTGGSLKLFLQARNRIKKGFNLLSPSKTVTWTTGQKVTITIESTARESGEEIFDWVVSAVPVGSPNSDAKQIALIKGLDSDQVTERSLPITIELTRDHHLSIFTNILLDADLPTNAINGEIRYSVESSKYYQFDSEAVSGDIAGNPSGYWIETSGWDCYITNTTDGCDQSINSLNSSDITLPPAYSANGAESTPVKMWLLNGLSEDGGSSIPIGSQIALYGTINDDPSLIPVLAGGIIVEVLGIARKSTGIMSASLDAGEYTYSGDGSYLFSLSDTIPRGYAIAVTVRYKFTQSSLTYANIPENSIVKTWIYARTKLGTLFPGVSYVLGDTVLANGSHCRIVPNTSGILRLDGVVANASYISPELETEVFNVGLNADEADQQVVISAALGGDIQFYSDGEPIKITESLLAIISTASGESSASSASNSVTIASNEIISLTVTHDCDINGYGTIRANYPDTDIANSNKGKFNAPYMRIYVAFDGDIYRSNTPIVVNPQPTQNIIISDLSDYTIVGSYPTNADNTFNLWALNTPSIAVSSAVSLLDTGSYTVRFSYYYPSPNYDITAISHSVIDGCLPVLSLTLADAINSLQYWSEPVALKTDLANIEPATEQVKLCLENWQIYLWDKLNTLNLENNGDSVIAAGTGRWISTTSLFFRGIVTDKADLKALPTASLLEGEFRICLENNAPYIYRLVLPSADDNDNYLESTDGTTEGWIKAGGSGGGGISATASVTTLKAIASGTLTDNQLIHVENENAIFQYYLGATAAENAPIIYRPNDYASVNGNWVRQSIITASGTSAVTSDFITEGVTNLYITSAQESKINNLPSNTTTELSNKADKTTTISAGTGLTGGGSLASNRTLSLSYSGLTEETAPENTDLLAIETGDGIRKLPLSSIPSNTWSAWTQTSTTINFASTVFPVQLTLTSGTNEGWVVGDYVVITESGGLSHTFKVTAKSSTNLITIDKDETLYTYPASGTITNGIIKTAGAKGDNGIAGSLDVFSQSDTPQSLSGGEASLRVGTDGKAYIDLPSSVTEQIVYNNSNLTALIQALIMALGG